MTKKSTARLLATAVILLMGSSGAHAQDRWFSIELLIFKNGGNAWQHEKWATNPVLVYPSPLLISTALELASDPETPIKELEFDGPLADAAAKLSSTGQYRVLYTRRWQQSLIKTGQAPNLLVTGGDTYGSHYELEGSIKFSVERYLHVNTNLWFTTFGEPEATNGNVAEDYVEEGVGLENGDYMRDFYGWDEPEEDFEEPMDLPSPPWLSDYLGEQEPVKRVVTLQQHRRLRSGETHYIDHPSIGILIRIEPVPATGELDNEY